MIWAILWFATAIAAVIYFAGAAKLYGIENAHQRIYRAQEALLDRLDEAERQTKRDFESRTIDATEFARRIANIRAMRDDQRSAS